jgi:hypothetical protein
VDDRTLDDCYRQLDAPYGVFKCFGAVSMGAASAQVYPRDVIAHCARITNEMRELGCMTCDGFRDRMRLACEANGGRIPGSRNGMEPFDKGPTAQDRRAQ